MNEPHFDPSDEALLEQAVRSMRDDLPGAARMQQLERRLAPVLVTDTPADRSWLGRHVPLVAGAVIVMVGVIAGVHHQIDKTPPSAARVPIEALPAAQTAPTAEAPTVTAELHDESPPAMPVVTVDSLPSLPSHPSAASQRSGTAPERSAKGSDEGRSDISTSPAMPAADPGDELALLEEARAALATAPGRTLALTDEHMKRFSSPAFAQERERLAIDALVRSGRRDDASERARRFESTYPSSPHLARVRALVAPPAAAP